MVEESYHDISSAGDLWETRTVWEGNNTTKNAVVAKAGLHGLKPDRDWGLQSLTLQLALYRVKELYKEI